MVCLRRGLSAPKTSRRTRRKRSPGHRCGPLLHADASSRTGVIAAHALAGKAVTRELVRFVPKDTPDMRRTRVILKSDNESAIKTFACRERDMRCHPEEACAYEPQANVRVEQGV